MTTGLILNIAHELVTRSFLSGVMIGKTISHVDQIVTPSLFPFTKSLSSSKTCQKSFVNTVTNPVKIEKDSDKEYLDIDVENMDIGKIYLVYYDNELQAVQRINENQVAFYEVAQ